MENIINLKSELNSIVYENSDSLKKLRKIIESVNDELKSLKTDDPEGWKEKFSSFCKDIDRGNIRFHKDGGIEMTDEEVFEEDRSEAKQLLLFIPLNGEE